MARTRPKAHKPELIEAVCKARGTKSAALIARDLGLTRNAVIGIWNRHSTDSTPTPRRWPAGLERPGTQPKYPWKEIGVGEFFDVPNPSPYFSGTASNAGQRYGVRFATIRIGGTIRVTRVA